MLETNSNKQEYHDLDLSRYIHTYNTTQYEAMGIFSHNLACHSAVVCYVHISNPGVWEILCLAMEKYSVWRWRNTQGVSLHNPAAEAHVT